MDPRTFDLHQMLAAFEASLRQASEDEKAWQRTRAQIYAEPADVRHQRRNTPATASDPAATPLQRHGMTLDAAQALIGQLAAADARYAT